MPQIIVVKVSYSQSGTGGEEIFGDDETFQVHLGRAAVALVAAQK
jgi:hypothetical protein